MRYLITIFILISSLYALTLQKGMSIVGMTATEILSEGKFRSDIEIIYGTVNGTWTSFNPNKKMAFNGLKELKKNQAYIIVVSRVMNLANATLGLGLQVKCPQLDAGVNIVSMYTANFANGIKDINGSKIKSMFSTKNNSYISYNPDVPLPLNSLQQTTNGRFYVIDVANDNVEACGSKTTPDPADGNTTPPPKEVNLPFTFEPKKGVARNIFIESNEVIINIAGLLESTKATLNSGVIVKNGNVLTEASEQLLSNGDRVKLKLKSSKEYNTTESTTFSFLGATKDFNVTTLSKSDSVAAEFRFDSLEVNPQITVISNQVQIVDIIEPVSATAEILFGATDVTIVQNGVDTRSRTVNVNPGDSINLKADIADNPSIIKFSVGEKSSNFDVAISDVVDYKPDSFSLTPKNDLDTNIRIFSDEVIVSGLDPFVKTYAAGLNADVFVNGVSSGNYALVQNKDIVKLAIQTPAQLGTPKIGQLYIGGEMAEFNITTTSTNPDQDDNPTQFTIPPVLNADVSTFVTSKEVVILGINILATVKLDKGILIVNGVEIPSNKTSVAEFDKIQIKAQSSDSYEDELKFNLTVGPVTKTFSVTTKVQPVNILLENQRYRKEQNVTLPISSAPAAIAWAIVGGKLPSGLIFDANRGIIEGTTSNTSEVTEYTIKATIVNGESSQIKRNIEVADYISTVQQTPNVDGGTLYDDTWYKDNMALGVPTTFERLFTAGIIQVNSTLNWLDIELGRKTYDEAVSYCENLEFGGYNSWRLPTIHELQIINGHQDKFDNIGAGFMWTSTPSAEKPDWYWYVDFGNGGKSYIYNKSQKAFFKCVVGAQ